MILNLPPSLGLTMGFHGEGLGALLSPFKLGLSPWLPAYACHPWCHRGLIFSTSSHNQKLQRKEEGS